MNEAVRAVVKNPRDRQWIGAMNEVLANSGLPIPHEPSPEAFKKLFGQIEQFITARQAKRKQEENAALGPWQCEIFGRRSITYRPMKGEVPNGFHRWMQAVCFGNVWTRVPPE